MIKALIDTNIILDIALERHRFYQDAADIFRKIYEQKLQGYISASSVTDIYYCLRKTNGKVQTVTFLRKLLKVIDIADVDKSVILNALYLDWNDFEDAVQSQTAIKNELDVLITRNTKDYHKTGKIKVFTPSDFLKQF
jgi:predicted nucleic acid-binding protein